MSGAFVVSATALDPIAVKLSGTSATDIVDATDHAQSVVWLMCTEWTGATPTLKVELYDGTTSYYLRNDTMTARERWLFDAGIPVPQGWKLRITAGTADKVDVTGAKLLRTSG